MAARLTPQVKRAIANRVLGDPEIEQILALYREEHALYSETRQEIARREKRCNAAFRALAPRNATPLEEVFLRSTQDPAVSSIAYRAVMEGVRLSRRGHDRGNVAARRLVARCAMVFLEVTGKFPTANGRGEETPFTIVAETLLEKAGIAFRPEFVADTLRKDLGLSHPSEDKYIELCQRFLSELESPVV